MFDHVFACSVNSRGGREDRLRAAADSSIPLLPKHGRGTAVRSVFAAWSPTRWRRGTQPVEAATWAAEEREWVTVDTRRRAKAKERTFAWPKRTAIH